MSETLEELRDSFARGELPRDEFWLRSQQLYLKLRERSPLPPAGVVRRIYRVQEDLIVELREGMRLLWNPEDLRTAPNMLLNHGTYEARELAVLLAVAAKCKVVLDVGANIGWYTLNIGRAVEGMGRVYAFEPIPDTFATLERNVALNGMRNVTLMNVGLGETTGEVEFYLPDVTGSVAASQRPLFSEQQNARVQAKVRRLDEVAKELGLERVDLIKCDIEGGELAMLKGGIETIRRFRPAIFLELLRKWSREYGYHPNDVIALLGAEGYRCYAIGERELEPIAEIGEDTKPTNFLFLQA
jgi:FkbM family methyltransferase